MDNKQLWDSVLVEIEINVSKANFSTWFKNTKNCPTCRIKFNKKIISSKLNLENIFNLSFDKLNISWLDIFMKATKLDLHNFNNINELVLSNLILQNENIVSNKVNFNNVNLTNSNISSNNIIFKSGDILNSKFTNFTKLNFDGTGLLNFVSSLFENINGNISEFNINYTFNEQDKTCKKIFFNTNLSTSTNLKTLSLKFNTFVQFIENNNKRLTK
jgi:hypothetical protein